MIEDGMVYVGLDAEVTLAASREMLAGGDSSEEQYRTANLVSKSLMKICVDGSTLTGVFSEALDLAIQNYDELPLTFAMARAPSAGCGFTINTVIRPDWDRARAGFPSGGLPYSRIIVGGDLSTFGVDTLEHVITHELGHTIGLRHSDYYDRSISCNEDKNRNEGGDGIGAIHVPGTPTTARVGGSIMNACFRDIETGEFTATDLITLRFLYSPPSPPSLASTQSYLTLDSYQNGAPGTASVSGNVFRGSGNTPAIGMVNVNFQKLEGEMWTTKSTAHWTLVNGHYEVLNWGVGVGQWRVRAVFPEQGGYASSESNYHEFSIQPVATNAFITIREVLNGQPGYASVSGNVQRTNGNPVSGTVNVNFQKLEGGTWTTKSTAHPTLVNGHYEVLHWGVGVGQWRVRVVFPEQGDYTSSESSYHHFEVKSGYRLVARHSNRCMSLSENRGANGTAILQWDCSGNPHPGDGQVFTLHPLGGGEFHIKINSTGKCVDVSGVSQADGAYLQQWDCLGAGQHNQVWRVIPIAGQPPYVAFQAKHSARCADVLGGGAANGVRIGQWGCWWGGNQQWYFQAIN